MEDRGDDGENAAPARVGVSRRLRRGDAILCSEEADDDVRDGAPGRGLRGVLGISGIIIFEADYENRGGGETPICTKSHGHGFGVPGEGIGRATVPG